ncbi:carbohydrate ABC transporter permease [Cohnella silvisoli]|uniref:Carbohydrate ABC transporter permease n=1 Tax=Cohnella silvisoli TaxID=2873699 RepID=A0ABV1KT37_9BACL|nr:carbohydrate ABC transporter permease [Cohnella silvisoli]MCD9021688.1 carbohydrate ABC transporter permease [Cohnella silvisoli]
MATRLNFRWFDITVGALFILLCFLTIYPFLYALSYSLSNGQSVLTQNMYVWPIDFTFDNYKTVFANNSILSAFYISVLKTVLGTALSLIVIATAAYSVSKKHLILKKSILSFFVIPMYISGGLLPFYILIFNLGLMNKFLVYLLPGAFSGMFMFLIKVYYETLPGEVEESAKIDGAGDFRVFASIFVPLSFPVYATVALFVGVAQWNAWFDAMLFMSNTDLHPLQLLLQNILREAEVTTFSQVAALSGPQGIKRTSVETLRMATLMVTTFPILFIYPFFQKYFIKGVVLGAVKG